MLRTGQLGQVQHGGDALDERMIPDSAQQQSAGEDQHRAKLTGPGLVEVSRARRLDVVITHQHDERHQRDR